jgi:hypothetical protein
MSRPFLQQRISNSLEAAPKGMQYAYMCRTDTDCSIIGELLKVPDVKERVRARSASMLVLKAPPQDGLVGSVPTLAGVRALHPGVIIIVRRLIREAWTRYRWGTRPYRRL